jgi:hypothetical protein
MAQSDNLLWMQAPELANARRRQQLGQQLMQAGGDSSPIQSPWQGVSRLAQALIGGYEARKGDEAITDYNKSSKEELARILADDGAGMPRMASPGVAQDMPIAPATPRQPMAGAPLLPPDVENVLAPIAAKYNVPLSLARALVMQESGGRPGAVGDGGQSIGLGQIQARTAADPGYGVPPMDPARRTDPAANLDFAMNYLTAKGRAMGATDLNNPDQQAIALRAYNGGGDPNYVQNVRSRMEPMAPAGAAPGAAPVGVSNPDYLAESQRLFAKARALGLSDSPLAQRAAPMIERQAAMMQQVALARQPREVQPIEAERLAQAAGLTPGTPEYQTAMRQILAGKAQGQVTNITMPPQTQTGPIPPGYQLVQRDGGLRMEVIPGGPADRTQQQSDKKEGLRDAATTRAANIVVEDIDRIGTLVDKSFFPVAGTGATTLSNIPGTAAHDAAKLLDGIKANVAFDKLQQMRESSPTGGALGAVSDREMALLQATLGSLEQSQSSQQFKENLKRLRTTYLDIVHGPGKWKDATAGDATPTAGPGGGWSIRPVQ